MHPNEALARREIELIEAGDLEALAEIYAPDLIIQWSALVISQPARFSSHS